VTYFRSFNFISNSGWPGTQGAFHFAATGLSPTAPLLGDAGSASRLASGAGISSRCRSCADSDDSASPLLQNSAGGMLHDFVFQS